MSSSSEALARQAAENEAPDKEWLAQLIKALATEVASLGEEITGVGDALSTRVFARGDICGVKEMQSFDALSQLARAQAKLLDTISRQLGAPTADLKEALAAGIAALPILEVRRRMLGAVHQVPDLAHADDPVPAGDDETWF